MSPSLARGTRPTADEPAPAPLRRRLVVAGTVVALVAATGAGLALTSDDDSTPVAAVDATSGPSAAPSVAPSARASTAPPAGPLTTPAPSADASAAPLTPAQQWRADVVKAYQPLAGSSFSAVRTIVEWNEGRATAADVANRIDAAVPLILETRTSLAEREPLPSAPAALGHFRAAADLYLYSMITVRTATTLPDGPLQDQLRRAGARSRDLGDRLYDLAGTVLAPVLPPAIEVEGFELRKPPEVPDYAAIDLGVGPPLEPAEPADRQPRTFQDERPSQPFDGWRRTVSAADVPADTELARLLAGGTAADLAAVARRLVASSDALYAAADPAGERTVGTQVQLSLLVQAEAARAAQAAALVSDKARDDLRLAAQGLAGVGDRLWDARLGVRRTAPGTPS